VTVRNFRPRPQAHRIVLDVPEGLMVAPGVLTGEVPPESRSSFTVRLEAAKDAAPGVRIVGLDVTLDGRRYGEWFDAVVEVVR
jgi:hypothetical protein